MPSDDLPTLTAPTRVSKTLAKSTCAIVSTSNPLLVPDATPAPAPDMASTMMEAPRTARAHEKQRRSALRGRQHADATQQPSAIINRRMPDKTHTRQPAPDHCGWATGENGRRVPATPTAPIWTPCAGHTTRSRPASPPTSWCTQPRPTPRCPDVARGRMRRWAPLPTVSLLSLWAKLSAGGPQRARNPLRIHPETFHFPY